MSFDTESPRSLTTNSFRVTDLCQPLIDKQPRSSKKPSYVFAGDDGEILLLKKEKMKQRTRIMEREEDSTTLVLLDIGDNAVALRPNADGWCEFRCTEGQGQLQPDKLQQTTNNRQWQNTTVLKRRRRFDKEEVYDEDYDNTEEDYEEDVEEEETDTILKKISRNWTTVGLRLTCMLAILIVFGCCCTLCCKKCFTVLQHTVRHYCLKCYYKAKGRDPMYRLVKQHCDESGIEMDYASYLDIKRDLEIHKDSTASICVVGSPPSTQTL